jgi:competence protein ComEA
MNANPLEPSALEPDPAPQSHSFRIEKLEVILIGSLLVLIVAGEMIQLRINSPFHEQIQEPTPESHRMVDWNAVPEPIHKAPVNLNLASRKDLIEIPGIGPALAEAILAYRKKHGSFGKVDDLDLVTGIGPRKLDAFQEFLTVNTESAEESLASATQSIPEATNEGNEGDRENLRTDKASALTLPVAGKVNLNTADKEQLMSIPGIGESFAERILAKRKKVGHFREWATLADIPGIGEKRLENIRRYATIE